MKKVTYEKRKMKVSARARGVLERIEQGRFYPAYENEPAAMEELKAAGLVAICGRVEVIRACYVPAAGYTPYKEEKFA